MVSRQREWQKRQIAAGKCSICGEKRVNATHCAFHAKQRAAHQRASYRKKNHSIDKQKKV